MGSRDFHLYDGKNGAALVVRITPRAKKNEIVSILPDGTVKIRITAPPVEGKANLVLLKFLANTLGVSMKHLEIVTGAKNRNKLVSIVGMEPETLSKKIRDQIGK